MKKDSPCVACGGTGTTEWKSDQKQHPCSCCNGTGFSIGPDGLPYGPRGDKGPTPQSVCKTCGQPILWVKTLAGKAMPLDPPELTVMTAEGQVVRGRVSHFATCPQAAEHRKAAQ